MERECGGYGKTVHSRTGHTLFNIRPPVISRRVGNNNKLPTKRIPTMSHVVDIPNFLLDQILVHLQLPDLQSARRVCTAWNYTILNRQRLRRKLFLQPPTIDTNALRQPLALHPVFRQLQSDWSIPGVPIVLTKCPSADKPEPLVADICQGKLVASTEEDNRELVRTPVEGTLLEDSPVKDHYATEPAVKKFIIVFPTYNIDVSNDAGVSVWDVATGVKCLLEEIAKGNGDTWEENLG
jgi:hypothetical protein